MLAPRTYLQHFVITLACGCLVAPPSLAQSNAPEFTTDIKPILQEHCFACHADGEAEGRFSLDSLFDESEEHRRKESWHKVLTQIRAGLMPPADEPQLSPKQVRSLGKWIKFDALGLNPDNLDPGRVTLRRLNQVEYRNTIHDLLDVDYDTTANFPADDTGHGFDNIGDVLSMSPLLLEKYVNAAKDIVSSVVPVLPRIERTKRLYGNQFVVNSSDTAQPPAANSAGMQSPVEQRLSFSYYTASEATGNLVVDLAGDYILRLNLTANETHTDPADLNTCEFTFKIDNEELLSEPFVRQGRREYAFEFKRSLQPGTYHISLGIQPTSESPQIRALRLDFGSLDLVGPHAAEHHVRPPGYERFFPAAVPVDLAGRRTYARKLLGEFASRAFRRPVRKSNLDRLVALAESVYADGHATFESGIAKGMTAILASPQFLFREEPAETNNLVAYPLIDQFALASRLSYFLWSTMPDDELRSLAKTGELRANLDSQITRMLQHEKAQAFFENFVGQWLRARAVDGIQINSNAVLNREPNQIDPESDIRRHKFFELFRKGDARTAAQNEEFAKETAAYLGSFGGGTKSELTDALRTAMRRETELHFEHVVSHNRSLLELIDCDYTFLNETLWAHYQIQGIAPVNGDAMRLVQLPPGSHRGGLLTQGTMLVVTSNPDRTSPVKRGLFILENLLGTPPPAPPPNIPALEDVKADASQVLSLRESLAIHRQDALCSSCHNQMDPLGLALENFNALGLYRTEELDQTIDARGQLNTGEQFGSVSELKRILATHRKTQIYRCIAEKMMTYALGRAVEYTDAHALDLLVEELESQNGKAQTLVRGIINSDAFQRRRSSLNAVTLK